MSKDIISRAKPRAKGGWFEDFEPGRTFQHHWGRTITQAENALFTTLTLHFNPQYTNVEFAKAMGHPDTPINPLLVFNTVFGLSVQDLSEHGIAFLSVDALQYHLPVYPGDTIVARSTVTDRRGSSTKPTLGIATWKTEGFNQRGELVCSFTRANLLVRRDPVAQDREA